MSAPLGIVIGRVGRTSIRCCFSIQNCVQQAEGWCMASETVTASVVF